MRTLLFGSLRFLLGSEGLEGCEDAVGPGDNADRRDIAPADEALGVDDEKRTLGCSILLAVHAVGFCNGALGLEIRQQGELEFALARVGDVTPGAVHRDAQKSGPESLELGKQFVVEG